MTDVQLGVTDEDEGGFAEPDFVPMRREEQPQGAFSDLMREEMSFENPEDALMIGEINLSPSGQLLKEYIKFSGFGQHHIDVYDNWFYNTADTNVENRMLKFKDGRVVTFENLQKWPPKYTRDGEVLDLTPKLAREQGVTYGSDWHVDVVMRKGGPGGPEIDRRRGVCIGTIPVMLKSRACILHGKSPRELAILGEDPNDPGGYFVVSGTEKVILLQERLSINKIFLMTMDSKGTTVARMTANTARGTALIELALDKATSSIIKIRFPSMRSKQVEKAKEKQKQKSINVLRIFRILGAETREEIERLLALFISPDHVGKTLLKLSRNLVDFIMVPDDLEIIASKMGKSGLTEQEKLDEASRILDTDLFPHLNDLQGQDGESVEDRRYRIAQSKLYLLAIMVARFLENIAGFRPVDDRNSWSNKRVEGAGRMMEQLFRNAWRKALGFVQGAIDSGDGVKDLSGVVEKIKYSTVTDTFHDSFVTSNWGVKGTKMSSNVAQTLFRDSVVATFAHINTVDVGISRTDRQPELRLVQPSQWGQICPVSTPEGENSGIVKNLSVTAKVSLERDDSSIIRRLIGDESKGLEPRVFLDPEFADEYPYKAMVNGKFLGWCDGPATSEYLIQGRRAGEFFTDMSVILEEDWLYVDISPSRLVRPLLIVDQDQRLVLDHLGLRGTTIPEMIRQGAIEYMSSWEQEYIKVAPTVDHIEARLTRIRDAEQTYRDEMGKLERLRQGLEVVDNDTVLTLNEAQERVQQAQDQLDKATSSRPYTHCELDPQAILGIAACLIPWPNHNQAPRNTYQVSMGKQALGVYHANHANRFDGKTKILAFPNRPMLETEMYEAVGLNTRGPGQNVTVAFMAYPNTEEDSFIIKKEFLDNGGFRIVKYLTYKTVVRHMVGDVIENLVKPEPRLGEDKDRYKYIQSGGPNSPVNGLPLLGAPLKQGDCVIGKIQNVPATGEPPRNESTYLRVGDEGIVDKVLVTSDQKTTVVTVKLRIMWVPQEGDKFAPRNAQKGTCGLVQSDVDLPFTEHGITPDIIVNTHSMPSRMTMEYLMEVLASKHGAMRGVHVNGGAFRPFEMNEYRETMKKYGLQEFGYENMRSGTSGKPLQALIFCGPVFFQALKHHVKDKAQVRSQGAVKPMTRQPPKGRGNRGGLRFGEMERDAAISHGASSFLRERLMYVSDGYQTAFCKACGEFAINNADTQTYKCRMCKVEGKITDTNSFGKATIPYAYKLLIHLLAPFGINLRPVFMSSDEYAARIFGGGAVVGEGEIVDVERDIEEANEAQEEEQEEYDVGGIDEDYEEAY